MSAITANLLIKALDGLSVRQVVTANNIANAGSPNFRPGRVTFEEALASAAGRDPAAVRSVRPRVDLGAEGALRLDLELANASTTSARYSALIEVLGRQLQIDALAVSRNN